MPEKVMSLLASITGGKSYKAHKYGLDHAERPYIDYGEDHIVWQETAETIPHRKYGIVDLSNYLLYNFEDEPDHLYYRMRINVDLCEELGVTIYSFPMKFHPISDPEYFRNRDYIGKHWNRKFIRAIQAVLNSTKGKVGRGVAFFEEAFGRNIDEFHRLLWMPEAFIIFRRKYDADLRARMADRYTNYSDEDCDLANEWWNDFCALSEEQRKKAEAIISLNRFDDGDYTCDDPQILHVLEYYKIGPVKFFL